MAREEQIASIKLREFDEYIKNYLNGFYTTMLYIRTFDEDESFQIISCGYFIRINSLGIDVFPSDSYGLDENDEWFPEMDYTVILPMTQKDADPYWLATSNIEFTIKEYLTARNADLDDDEIADLDVDVFLEYKK